MKAAHYSFATKSRTPRVTLAIIAESAIFVSGLASTCSHISRGHPSVAHGFRAYPAGESIVEKACTATQGLPQWTQALAVAYPEEQHCAYVAGNR
eukprot:scaffold206379_cov25-Prasinocladus_malaysianus.AAC.1